MIPYQKTSHIYSCVLHHYGLFTINNIYIFIS